MFIGPAWGIRRSHGDGTLYQADVSQEMDLPPCDGFRICSDAAPPSPVLRIVKPRQTKRGRDAVCVTQERAWKQRKFSDSEVVCSGVHIAVHRATLSAASPVFDAAFSSQMSEGNTATYEIKDSTPTAVEAMLRYIYIGDSDCLPDDLAFLLDLSAQYELDDLCAEVLERMAKDLTSWQARDHRWTCH